MPQCKTIHHFFPPFQISSLSSMENIDNPRANQDDPMNDPNGKVAPATTKHSSENDAEGAKRKPRAKRKTQDEMKVAFMRGDKTYASCIKCCLVYSKSTKNDHVPQCKKEKVDPSLQQQPRIDPDSTFPEKAVATETTHPSSGSPIGILSYSLWHKGICMPERMKGVKDIVHKEQPDVLLFQEVTPAMLECVEPLLVDIGFTLVSGGDNTDRNVIFLRQESIWKHQSEQCKPLCENSPRRLRLVTLSLETDPSIVILIGTSYLEKCKEHEETRRTQIQTCFRLLGEDTTLPFVFGGNTNFLQNDDSKVIIPDNIEDAWISCGSDPQHRYTWDTGENSNLGKKYHACRFDRFYYSKSLVRTTEFLTVGKDLLKPCELYCSDHWGIMATMSVVHPSLRAADKFPLPIAPPLPKVPATDVAKPKAVVTSTKDNTTLNAEYEYDSEDEEILANTTAKKKHHMKSILDHRIDAGDIDPVLATRKGEIRDETDALLGTTTDMKPDTLSTLNPQAPGQTNQKKCDAAKPTDDAVITKLQKKDTIIRKLLEQAVDEARKASRDIDAKIEDTKQRLWVFQECKLGAQQRVTQAEQILATFDLYNDDTTAPK